MSKIKIFSILLLAGITLASCSKKEESGLVRFDMSGLEETLKSTGSEVITAALITIERPDGGILYDKYLLPLYRFGSTWVTATLEIAAGDHILSEFMLIDEAGQVIWATPREGSDLAHLVEHPLPRWFEIDPGSTTKLDIEVVRVEGNNPGDFGYLDFEVRFVDEFCMQLFYVSDCFNGISDTTPGAPVYQPELQIMAENYEMLIIQPLEIGPNRIQFERAYEWLTFTVLDCRRDTVFHQSFKWHEVLEYQCSPDYPFLEIYRDSIWQPMVVITPEGLTEPDIRQGIFGFVGSQLPDTTANGDYGVIPLVRDIRLYPYSVMESIRTFAPMNCYFPEGALPEAPLATVRSNSQGYFQLRMKAGEYLYLVREEQGWYFDGFVSSHLPGLVKVEEGQVSKIKVLVVDCSMWAGAQN